MCFNLKIHLEFKMGHLLNARIWNSTSLFLLSSPPKHKYVFARGYACTHRSKSLPNSLYAWLHPREHQRCFERTRIVKHVPICGIVVIEIKDLTVILTHLHTKTHTLYGNYALYAHAFLILIKAMRHNHK